jgi:outer membrane protein assembly factor BamB
MTASTLLALTLFLGAEPTENWPEFRGPTGDGQSAARDLPSEWSETKNVRWKTPIPGKAWASPVIWGSQIWLSNATADGKELSAVCVERATGKILHNVVVFRIEKPFYVWPVNSYASSTPAIEEGRLYVHYGSAGTACIDTQTGKIRWARQDLPCNHFRGPASSPILFGDRLILTFDGYDLQYVAALDKATGKTLWKTDRQIDYKTNNGDLKKGFATPTIVSVNGKPQLVAPSTIASQAFDPFTGVELWRVYHGGMNNAPRPFPAFGRVIVGTGEGGWRLFAVRPDGKGDVTASHVDWKFSKAVPARSSPLLVGEKLYMVNEAGVVSIVHARTGEGLGQERLRGPFSASPIHADGRLYFFNEEGAGYVVEPGDAWKLVATNRLDDGCMASPAAVGKSLFVRTKTHLYCLERAE